MKRKLKRSVIYIGSGVIVLIILLIVIISHVKTINSMEYKLKQIGYNDTEIVSLKEALAEDELKTLLDRTYDAKLVNVVSEKYFLWKNLDAYLTYYAKNPTLEASKVVALVNVGRDKAYYTNVKTTDTTKDELMLVNKYQALDETYVPTDLKTLSLSYAYSGKQLTSVAVDALEDMFDAAKKEGYTLIVASAYRSYQDQASVYNSYQNSHGTSYADEYAARAGSSEHQTGLAVDIDTYPASTTFKDTKEYAWLQANSYKYGFILRYPEDATDITGYTFEPWHYRYVGIATAKIIYDEGLTLDEYYAYYIEK